MPQLCKTSCGSWCTLFLDYSVCWEPCIVLLVWIWADILYHESGSRTPSTMCKKDCRNWRLKLAFEKEESKKEWDYRTSWCWASVLFKVLENKRFGSKLSWLIFLQRHEKSCRNSYLLKALFVFFLRRKTCHNMSPVVSGFFLVYSSSRGHFYKTVPLQTWCPLWR